MNAADVYAYLLTEDEWYPLSEERREALREYVVREAREYGTAKYATILVEPDAVLSVAGKATRHAVFNHTFPVPVEDRLKTALGNLLSDPQFANVGNKRVVAILRAYLEAYDR